VTRVSHLHNDHLHLPSLRRLGRSTPVVVPRGAGRWLRGHGFTAVEELAPGKSLTDGGLTVTATAADHCAHRWGPRFTHGPHAPAVGHLVSGDGASVYPAGDTDLFPGMADLGESDVAAVPVWLHPRSFADLGEVVGAEHLHRVLRGRLTDLGHPQPVGDHPADVPVPTPA
jgi:L-ascorbate metabolism protein UlaG (beta-lactamase superfamily)